MISTWQVALAAADRPEGPADVPGGVGPAAQQRSISSGRAEVVKSRSLCRPAEHRVADRSADQRQLVPGGAEARAELVDDRGDPVELSGHVALRVGQPDASRRSAICCVGHGPTA